MCTAFAKRGNDFIVGFNCDLAEDAFMFKVHAGRDAFYVGIIVGKRTYKTHGVNRNGNAGNLPFMNGPIETKLWRGGAFQRIDLLNERFIAGKLSYAELLDAVRSKTLVNIPGMSMHSQFTDRDGHILLVEPGNGYREIDGAYSVLSNFPALQPLPKKSEPYFGLDRYETATDILKKSDDGFSVEDGLALLDAVKQTGPWPTRVSFLYSRNDNAVYYALDGNFSNVTRLSFA